MSQAWIDDVEAYCGIAAVDVYLDATQLRRNDHANLYYPGEFRYGGGHALSYGTEDYLLGELRIWFTPKDLKTSRVRRFPVRQRPPSPASTSRAAHCTPAIPCRRP